MYNCVVSIRLSDLDESITNRLAGLTPAPIDRITSIINGLLEVPVPRAYSDVRKPTSRTKSVGYAR